jgi:hypothetical protein
LGSADGRPESFANSGSKVNTANFCHNWPTLMSDNLTALQLSIRQPSPGVAAVTIYAAFNVNFLSPVLYTVEANSIMSWRVRKLTSNLGSRAMLRK